MALYTALGYVLLTVCSAAESSDKGNGGYTSSNTVASMLKGYDKAVRPDGKGPTKVTVSLYLEYTKWQKNELHTILYLRQFWTDPRLKRTSDVTRFNAIDVIDHLWTPNTYFITGLRSTVINKGLFDISPSGDVLWSQAIDFHLPCPQTAKVAYETDGLANCTIPIESYSLLSKDLVYSWDTKEAIGQNNYPDAVLSSITTASTSKYSTGDYSSLIVNIKLQTKASKAVIDFAAQQMFDKF